MQCNHGKRSRECSAIMVTEEVVQCDHGERSRECSVIVVKEVGSAV